MLIMVMLLTSVVSYSKELNTKLINKTIVLDAGHGGKDKGTSVDGIYESDINLNIVLKLRNELIKQGVNVILTRDGDYDLSSPNISRRKKSDFDNRIKLINNSNADLYISIHINYLDETKYYGAQVFYNNDNKYLTESIQKYLNNNLITNREIKEIPTSTYMYKKLEKRGVLIECGFLSNTEERNKLVTEEYQREVAKVIAQAVVDYYK